MKVNISSVDNLFITLINLKNNDNDVNNIDIINLDSSVIPYMDFFIDSCRELGCDVRIEKQLLVNLDILEHFSDRMQIH